MMARIAAPRLAGVALAAVMAAIPAVAAAQGRGEIAVIGAPAVTSFGYGSGAAKRTISQSTMPFVVLLPISEHFSMDLSTAFASSEVAVNGAAVSSISGLTDTQVRGNYALGESMLITAGLNLPTGQYLIPASQQEAAGQIGNDFLNYGVSTMGTGFALTGGVAYARPIGTWNLGLGTSLRKATRFDAFEVDSAPLRFTPSDELRLRVGVDRPIGDGQIDLGLSYSAFGVDVADTTTYSTGDRIIATAGWSFPVRGVRAYLSAWNLLRLAGEQLGGPAPGENVFNITGGGELRGAGDPAATNRGAPSLAGGWDQGGEPREPRGASPARPRGLRSVSFDRAQHRFPLLHHRWHRAEPLRIPRQPDRSVALRTGRPTSSPRAFDGWS